MRQNTERVYRAWRAGHADRADQSIWTDGRAIYSYATVLVERDTPEQGGTLYVNETRYSVTTTQHQRALLALAEADGLAFMRLRDVPRGLGRLAA